ncbi:MAG: CDP-diacylglycerol--glycerol-3-phosphate 3-phosphatidyltransferase [Candidatus Omnitrophica bacterium CG11_big_fil_rev_8_21_14_0_20_45_26]|uniref:CDP-diacylglycerol--glycerol-3-phosphate 3-phosphatidyltransferase n=1 Tax=Candidatus Abzuiibacterium crystallinum TaxID=1974748 RepID=A0A2H0LUW1_9BACT|nr:MAG: CDP-diacylglycerol--glycerol-3-phosphate 3-phosphatidyltransferase [Candidatus Omnitrophica bacterium CG11_big_fil_rev_8_21_14_0_20_45_26]PIW65034.1 MAG: CDP-diacylglycerol--glycerol-3-phosphate 3-phosphatidyltransferase [Candidatus Omnitrophica bacterium CG12_big_fil_rev_8_21_14_0_65_45_16]
MSLPNYITILRILLVPVVYLLITYYTPAQEHYRWWALYVFAFASLTDAIDGFICRRWNLRTTLGTILDPLADKLLLISTFIAISNSLLPLKPPSWVVIIIIFRDLFIVSGLLTIVLTTNKLIVKPNWLGKLTTFGQMLTVLLILLNSTLAPPIWWLTAWLTVASGIVYILRELKQLNRAK